MGQSRPFAALMPCKGVMPGLDAGIHADASQRVEAPMEWIAGSNLAMTRTVANG